MLGDTIAAISTPHGKGGVALLRVSGPDAVSVAGKMCRNASYPALKNAPDRMGLYCHISVPRQMTDNPNVSNVPNDGFRSDMQEVDTGIVTVFYGPHSFTGEDTVEIACHGGILLTELILSGLFYCGARPAEAGEFTKRAFINGKMSLSSAEALRDLLESATVEQVKLSHGGLSGKLSVALKQPYETITRVLASLYAKIDFPDEDLEEITGADLLGQLIDAESVISHLCETYRTGHAIAEGIPTVICGRPNVGKSALYNSLLGREAAIVTDVAGTTRDILREKIALGRVTLLLHDTAGLHETDDPVEHIGIDRAKSAIQESELLLCLFDGNQKLTPEDVALKEYALALPTVQAIGIITKNDLPEDPETVAFVKGFPHFVSLSATSGAGLEDLKNMVEQLYTDGKLDVGNEAVVADARQFADMHEAQTLLRKAISLTQSGLSQDIVGEVLEDAMHALGRVDGKNVNEDIVTEIFSHFCVGK